MLIFEIFILAIALAIDAMLVSFSYGLIINNQRIKTSLIMAVFFGFFQALMPIAGWFLSSLVYSKFEVYSKYIVFFIFMFLGLKFIFDIFKKEESNQGKCISLACLLWLSVATSIDAFAAGISIKFSNMPVFFSAFIICCITFVLSLIGFWISEIFKKFPSSIFELIGGILLISLGIKALI